MGKNILFRYYSYLMRQKGKEKKKLKTPVQKNIDMSICECGSLIFSHNNTRLVGVQFDQSINPFRLKITNLNRNNYLKKCKDGRTMNTVS